MKCNDTSCPLNSSCKRFNPVETSFTESPYKDGDCDWYYGDPHQNIIDTIIKLIEDD